MQTWRSQSQSTDINHGRVRRRVRLYSRGVHVLSAIQQPGQRLVWCAGSGRYLVNGEQGRSNRVIPRTLEQLIRLNCLRSGVGQTPSLFISETGRRLLKRFEDKAAMPTYRPRCTDQRRSDASTGSTSRQSEANVAPGTD